VGSCGRFSWIRGPVFLLIHFYLTGYTYHEYHLFAWYEIYVI
jgi:hypothetical protein